ncbi:MAG: DUF1735 domain-containing protein [Chitinophagaceae bacterium]|nr:MAG: DUF1735 domain-containing protein [Chitinophagaceae bacterium]
MKQCIIQKITITTLFAAGIFSLTSCNKNDNNHLDFGYNYIYVPQSLQSGGINLNYLVPNPNDVNVATQNYMIDTAGNRLDVILGVARSGMQAGNAFTVNVQTNPDTINEAIANNLLQVSPNQGDSVVLLQDKAYTLPSTVSVPEGQTSTTFLLSIDIDQLKALSGKKAALAVSISGPSKYKLNTAQSEVIILIDVNTLNLP